MGCIINIRIVTQKVTLVKATLISAAVTGKIEVREERKNHEDTEGTEGR